MNDAQLLQAYVASRDQAAFRQLVERHLPMVYAAAKRQARDAHLAEDVAQAVFIVLARKADRIAGHLLPGWLLKTTRYAACEALRSRARRQQREQRASAMKPAHTDPQDDPQWKQLEPILDEALAKLGDVDRSAVTMRFLQGASLADVGRALGISEQAAQKRVSRALEKMRAYMTRRDVPVTTAGLATIMSAHAAEPLPAALTQSIATVGAAGGSAAFSASAAAIANGVIKAMAVKQLQLLGIVAAALLALAAIVAAQLLLERNPPHAAASPAPAAAPVQRAIPQDPGPISVGILLSHYTATGPSWTTRGPFGYLRATQAIRALDDGDIELYAVIDPGTEQVPEIQQLASRHFDGRIIDGSDPAALGRLDAIVCYFAWNLPDEVQAAMIQAIRGGTGLLIQASAGSYNPGYNENTSTLHAIRNGEWFYRMEASECRVVGDHPLLAGLMDLPDGVITLSVLSGSIGQIQGTPLIEAVDVPPMNRVRTWTTQRDAAGDSPAQDDPPRQFTPYYPLYIAELGRGRIVVCQWEAAGPEFVKRTGGNFHLRCIQWLARRPIDG